MKRWFLLITLLCGFFLNSSLPAQALRLGFDEFRNHNTANSATGESQLFVDVTDTSGGEDLSATQALFTFLNLGPNPSSITDVYFDDGTLLGIAGLIDADDAYLGSLGHSGVEFSQGASPGDLPGGTEAVPPFQVTEGFLADSDGGQGGVQAHGVNPGEWLGIVFDLQGVLTLADVFEDLATGNLRIGIHVQGFADGGSESFINDPPDTPVPEPATMLLFGSGLVWMAALGRKRLHRKR